MVFVQHFVTRSLPFRRVIRGRLISNRSLLTSRENFRRPLLESSNFLIGRKILEGPKASRICQNKGSFLRFRILSTSSSISEEAQRFVEEAVEKEPVVVFSKSWCPYCAKVKGLFQSLGIQFKTYDLDKLDIGDDIQAALLQKTGQRTVPNVFVSKEHVGGCSETFEKFENGTLAKLLEKAEIHIN